MRACLATGVAGIALALAACSGGSETTTSRVASLADVAGASEVAAAADTPADTTVSVDEAALEFSQCMRDENLDFPDVGVDAEGNPDIRSSITDAGLDPRSEEFRTAMQACRDTLQDSGFGGGGRAALADNPEIQDAFVAYSECLRDEGLNAGDLQLGGQPGEVAAGGAGEDRPPRGEGQGQGGFANRTNRIADQLGLDAEDPAVAAALETCGPVLDAALGQFGGGPGNNG